MNISDAVLSQYEPVIGLEVHVELSTKTKIFCSCPTAFGAEQNTSCCPICTGMPGSLPKLNRKVVEYAVKAGLALGCEIRLQSKMDRKNYFYPDLPKAYQISQFDLPLCTAGSLTLPGGKQIGITRIHIEEDAGKLIHDKSEGTLIDCNRCGVPLIEIVSEPQLASGREVSDYVKGIREVMRYIGISDCKMNEGSLRCDINLSVRKKGQTALGERTEMKNLNSFRFMEEAVEYEFARQVSALERGERITRQTRRYDPHTKKTVAMRDKEDLSDYRFFAEPDLPPIVLSAVQVAAWRESLPMLPAQRRAKLLSLGVHAKNAALLTAERDRAEYFDAVIPLVPDIAAAAQLLVSEVLPKCPEEECIPFSAAHFAAVCKLLYEGSIGNIAARKVIASLFLRDTDPLTYVKQNGLMQIRDVSVLTALAKEVMAAEEKSVLSYLAGKQAAAQAIIGKVIKKTEGRGDPNSIREIVLALLEQRRNLQ